MVLLPLMLAPVVVGVALGYLFGGRLAGFGAIRIRALWLVWLAAAVQFAQYRFDGAAPMLAVIFAAVLAWLAVNLPGWPRAVRAAAVVIVLGASLNGLAIALNGRMPYDAGDAGSHPPAVTAKNEPADAGTRLAVLGDTMAIPPLRAVVSPGDLLIGGGSCAFVVFVMRRRSIAEEVKPDDPHPELAARRPRDVRAGDAGDAALHGRRADDRGQLNAGAVVAMALLLYLIGAPHEHGG
ncbi:DUF5317 family protein [Actinoplanes sp. NPDC049668]|uniref:DUF5317 family protein n=1 Tax=unclassified Actinoplanes TaxID=2626549 RepID=UPI0033B9B46A